MTSSVPDHPEKSNPEASAHERFIGLEKQYARYRPSYAREMLERVAATLELPAQARVADIGAGTGIFSEWLLERGFHVAAVEPNTPMLAEARSRLGQHSRFHAVNGSAARTTLAPESVEAIFCAQALHWFNEEATLFEWRRILRPAGCAILVWNNLDLRDDFTRRYADLVREFSTDSGRTIDLAARTQRDPVIIDLKTTIKISAGYDQILSLEGLIGRTDSVSYVPKSPDPLYDPLVAALHALFQDFQTGGKLALRYESVAFVGKLRPQ